MVSGVEILEEGNLEVLKEFDEFVISNDDVLKDIAEKYLVGKTVSYDTTFLRWNKMNSVTNNPVDSDIEVSEKEFDKQMMGLAQEDAEKSSDWWRRVGATLIKDGKIILKAHNSHAVTENTHYIDGEPRSNFNAGQAIADLVIFQHGESSVISQAAKEGISTQDAEIYVTVFPCPTCAMLIAKAGIKKVYYREGYSLLDAQRILKDAGVSLIRVV